ncbi:porin [Burkholderia gladioli]|nr:porin [Burkholderia gladioli]MBU9172954.1 porin [Burkholderia gladioli]
MKRNTKFFALPLCLGTLACSAYAQSSITLYGHIDEGLNFTNSTRSQFGQGHSKTALVSGSVGGSRFGLQGTEILGGGNSAVFRLENGYDLNSGGLLQGGRMFGRQAYVGLASNTYGTVLLGRQYDPTIDMFSDLTAPGHWAGNVAAVPFNNDNSDWNFRVDNSVKYISPTINGFSGEAMYGFSNAGGGFAENRLVSAAGQYQMGGLTAAVAYMKIDKPGENAGGAVSTGEQMFTAASQQNIDAGFNYSIGKSVFGLTYSHTEVDKPTANTYFTTPVLPGDGSAWASWKFDNFGFNGQYYVTPSLWCGASYTYTIGNLDTTLGHYRPHWHSVALMVSYSLSRSTSIYAQGAYQHVVSAGTGTQFDDAQIVGSGPSTTPNQMVYRLAMVHNF